MKVFVDGLDVHSMNSDFFSGSGISFNSIERKKPFLCSSRYCVPFPFFPFLNFVFYPKKVLENIDLIYAFKVFPLNKIPWVADAEEFHYLNAFNSFFRKNSFLGKAITKKGLSSFYCKKIVCLSNYSKKTVDFFGGKKLAEKTVVSFPSVRLNQKKRKQKEKISLLFVATNPVFKGTEFVFNAFSEIKKKFDVELNCLGNFPEETKKRFPEINFDFVSSTDFTSKILPQTDILLMPSLLESFGFTALQAFACSVPVISSDIMALPEINSENKTGFLINFPESYHKKIFFNPYSFLEESKKLDSNKIVSDLTEKTSLLIEDFSLRKKMGKNAFNEVLKGKFSAEKKKNQMKEIFSGVLNKGFD